MRDDAAEQPRHDPVEHLERAPHHPQGAVTLADVVRDHAHLDARDLGELTGTQDAEALHPLDTELLGGPFRARHVCTRRDRKDDGLGK